MNASCDPTVSVRLITYNHEAYIAQAIESALMQQTEFPYEIIIGEDDSSDNTRSIVKAYGERCPDKIRLLLNDRSNVIYINGRPTGRWNFVNTLKHAKGKYIALLDGDDYWTDPHKLQKQVDFLERNQNYSICGHWVGNVDGNNNLLEKQVFTGQKYPEVFGVEHALGGTPIHTSSWLFRNSAVQNILCDKFDLFMKLPAADDPLLLMLLTQGQGYCFQEFQGMYRIHSGGTWVAKKKLLKGYEMLQFYYAIPRLIGNNYTEQVNTIIKRSEHHLAKSLLTSNLDDWIKFLHLIFKNEFIPKRRIPVLMIWSMFYFFKGFYTKGRTLMGKVVRKLKWLLANRQSSNK